MTPLYYGQVRNDRCVVIYVESAVAPTGSTWHQEGGTGFRVTWRL